MLEKESRMEKEKTTCSEQLIALRDSLEVLGGKWKLQILRYLTNRPEEINHFKKIQREITGISAKVLSKELKDMEDNLLVTRTVQETKPVTVAYAVTDYAKTVFPVTNTLVEWGINHRKKIIEK